MLPSMLTGRGFHDDSLFDRYTPTDLLSTVQSLTRLLGAYSAASARQPSNRTNGTVCKCERLRLRSHDTQSVSWSRSSSLSENNTALRFFLAERRVLCPPVMPPFLSCQVVLYLYSSCSMLFDFKLPCSLYTGCKNAALAAAKWYHVSLAQHFSSTNFARSRQSSDISGESYLY